MASFSFPQLLLLISLLLYTSITINADQAPSSAPVPSPTPHHHHRLHPRHRPPTPPPLPSPSPPPSPPPPSPSPPPSPPPPPPSPSPPPPPSPSPPPPPKKVIIQGTVYCKSCDYRGLDRVLGLRPTPLWGAMVKLQCKIRKNIAWAEIVKTNRNGNFLFRPQKLTTWEINNCRVFLVSSPLRRCGVATNYHGGLTGSVLKSSPTPKTLPYQFYTVGPFAFEPPKKLPCHH